MTAAAELIGLELENQIAGGRLFLAARPELSARYGTAMDTVAGLATATCAVWDHPLFNRAIGAGVLGALDERGIDQVVRHFEARGRTPCVEVYPGVTPSGLIDALARAGWRDTGQGYESHVLETDRALEKSVPGVDVRRVGPAEYLRLGELVRDGFEMGGAGRLAEFFVDLTATSLEVLGAHGAGFIASVEGEDAGTGELLLTAHVAGCYSGSVLAKFRGRGIQKVLIAARVNEGLARGRRIFVSQADPDSPSGHNLHDVGFRTLYRATWYARPA